MHSEIKCQFLTSLWRKCGLYSHSCGHSACKIVTCLQRSARVPMFDNRPKSQRQISPMIFGKRQQHSSGKSFEIFTKRDILMLLSCAVHYHSSRAQNSGQTLCQLFRETCVYDSEGFSKILCLQQDGHAITAESARGTMHLDDNNGKLRIFVPRNKRDRNLCYSSQLPKALVNYLGISDPAASGIFRTVMTSSNDILDDLLEEDGIIQVLHFEPSNQTSNDGEDSGSEATVCEITPSSSSTPSGPRPWTPSSTSQYPTDVADSNLETDSEEDSGMLVAASLYLSSETTYGSMRSGAVPPRFVMPSHSLQEKLTLVGGLCAARF